jgi:hypothetical protein
VYVPGAMTIDHISYLVSGPATLDHAEETLAAASIQFVRIDDRD